MKSHVRSVKPTEAQAVVAPATDEDPKVRLEKEIRKLKKKIRECDGLLEKRDKGEALSGPEEEKIKKLTEW